MNEFFSIYLNQFTYIGLVVALVVIGLGLPIPESIILIFGGLMAYSGKTNLYYTISACYAGVLTGDIVSYHLGRRWGHAMVKKATLKGMLTPEKWSRLREYFSRHENKTIFLSRFIPGFRVATHVMAGMLKVGTLKYLFLNGIAALINVPFTVYLGYIFGHKAERALTLTRGLTLFTIAFLSIGAGAGIIYYLIKLKKAV